jgi:hypothetical protein
VQGCPLSQPYQNTDATGQAGMQIDRQTLCLWVAQSAECTRTKKTKERKWTMIRVSRTGWMKVRRRCRTRLHLLLWCKNEIIISTRKCFTWRSCLLLRLEPRWHIHEMSLTVLVEWHWLRKWIYCGEILLQCDRVHNTFHRDWPGLEHRSQWREDISQSNAVQDLIVKSTFHLLTFQGHTLPNLSNWPT